MRIGRAEALFVPGQEMKQETPQVGAALGTDLQVILEDDGLPVHADVGIDADRDRERFTV